MLKFILKPFWSGQKEKSISANGDIAFTVCRVRRPDGVDGLVDVVTLLPPEVFSKWGVANETIVGFCTKLVAEGTHIDAATFRPNKAFVDLLHDVIKTNAPEVPEFQTAARRQDAGWACILDARTRTPAGEVPAHDIIGSFEVRDGAIVPNSYSANRNHLLFSSDGLFKLPSTSLQEA